MLKVVLKYTDCLQDGRNVFEILTRNNVEILKTRQIFICDPKIVIRIKNYDKLNMIVSELNQICRYEVRIVSVKQDKCFRDFIRKLFK